MYKVYVISDIWNDVALVKKEMTNEFTVIAKVAKTSEEIINKCKDADVLVIGYEEITNEVMDALPNLKLIQCMSIGVNSVNLEYARTKNIVVANVPTYCINEVADHAVALLLSLNRKILQYNDSVKNNEWDGSLYTDITRLGNCTVGLLGFGHIPKLVSKRLQAFSAKVIAYDPYITQEMADGYNVEMVTLEELLKNADYISCHLPLNQATGKMINREWFEKMKNGVVFINTSRGGVVDEDALSDALDTGKIGYAGLDVLADEYPEIENHPLNHRENVILTPHIAYYSLDSEKDLMIFAGRSVKDYFEKAYDKVSIVNK